MYSFAIDPEHEDATGEINMSLVNRQLHTLTLTPCPYSRSLRIYALGYNVISVKDGDLQTVNTIHEGGQETVITAEKVQNNSYPGLYPFTTFTFTSLGNTGRFGPTSNTYPSVPWTSPSQWYIYKGSQYWTAPANGIYQITAAGAMGEASGHIIQGSIALYEGQVLKLLVGQIPVPSLPADNATNGGGGCSSVSTDANVPILVGAGGDGGSFCPRGPVPNANIYGAGAGAQVTTLIPHQLSTGLYVSITGGTIFDGSYQINVVSNVAFQIATSIAGIINYPNAGTTVPATPQDGVFQPYGNGQGGGTGFGVAGAGYFTNGQYPDLTFPFLLPKAIAAEGYGNQYVYGGNYNPQPGIPPPPAAPVAEGGFGGGQCPLNLVSNIISISNQGPYPLIPGSNIYAIETDVINGLPQGYFVIISGVQTASGNFYNPTNNNKEPNAIIKIVGLKAVVVIANAVGPFDLRGATIYGAALGIAGGGGYTGSPGNGLQGATCYASDQVTDVQDLGLNAGSGYITISLV
jgi:hypothetical protein